ncbi:MAG: bifunctional biotin--[acetyl-CoA-carboxylase] ligase/biotin operon repressor BirA [Gammaproteobacteria bacterium]|nr:bifunctional biotin--[acetyl-CoA-carboxylase] ligase/biotin operon repressor BirA [Gammaproteobacteria bacterium]
MAESDGRLPATRRRLLGLLADGDFHSGKDLGAQLGLSRGAIWKHIQALESLGLDVFRVPGRGYRLARPLELLDAAAILDALPAEQRQRIDLNLLDTTASTNAWLVARASSASNRIAVCLAEHQSGGRGRRGRQWVSPFGRNLYLSVDWPFASLPRDFSALSLLVGLAVQQAIEALGVDGVRLKWPNDLLAAMPDQPLRKLGGILLEMRGEPPGPCHVVIGIGINVAMPERGDVAASIDQPWINLDALADSGVDRSSLAGKVLAELLRLLPEFETRGFAPFKQAWESVDAFAGCNVDIIDGDRRTSGVARGVSEQGALLLDTGNGIERIVVGDVSMRSSS